MVKRQISSTLIVGGFVLLMVVMIAFASVATVSAGHRGVLLTYGKVEDRILQEGITFVTPFVNQVVLMSVQTQKYSSKASSASSDLQTVSTEVTLNYKINENSVNKIYQELSLGFEESVIAPAIQEVVKASTAKYTAEELITKRESVKSDIEQSLRERLSRFGGIEVQTLSITDFQFSSEFNNAIEKKVQAEQDALTAKNRLSQIEYEAKQKIATAYGEANATLTKAIAEAEGLRIQSEAISKSKDILQLRWIERWNGVLPTTMLGENTQILIPLGVNNTLSLS